MADRKNRGDPIGGIQAATWNKFVDAADWVERFRVGTPNAPNELRTPTDKVKVENQSGGDRLDGEVLELDGQRLLNEVLADYLWLNGILPTGNNNFCILRQPAKTGDIVDGQVSGVCRALVTITDPGHTHAVPMAGQPTLQSATAGPVVLLHKFAGTGLDYCIVLLDRSAGETVCFPIQYRLSSPAPAIPPYGCVTYFQNTATDIINGQAQAIADLDPANPGTYDRWGFSFVDQTPTYLVAPVSDHMSNNAIEWRHLALNGSQSIPANTGVASFGTGHIPAECPQWGLLYDGFNRAELANYLTMPWGPIYFGDPTDVRNFDLWPGIPGFRIVGYPAQFEISAGVWRWRALFVRDIYQPIICRAIANWFLPSASEDAAPAVAIKTTASGGEVYDGSDAQHPRVAFDDVQGPSLRHSECIGLDRNKSLSIFTNDDFSLRWPTDGTQRFFEIDRGLYTAVIDEVQGTLCWSFKEKGRGWALANGTSNAPGNGGTGLNATGRFLRFDPISGGLGGSETHTHVIETNPDILGNNTAFFQTDSLVTAQNASNLPPYIEAALYERLGPA